MRSVKTLFLILLAVAIPISLQAWDPKTEKRIKEFKEEFKGVYIVDGTDIYLQRVIEFLYKNCKRRNTHEALCRLRPWHIR